MFPHKVRNGSNLRCNQKPIQLLIWFREIRAANLPIGGPVLKEKALQIAEKLGITIFNASDGWLTKFRTRHGIVLRSVIGKAEDLTTADTQFRLNTTLLKLVQQYKPEDIYNANECALFYQLLPDRTMAIRGNKCEGGKLRKQRLTILFRANMTGSDKLAPLVIGGWKNSRCLKNVQSLPVSYDANSR